MRNQLWNRKESIDSNRFLILAPNHQSTLKTISAQFQCNHITNNQISPKCISKDIRNSTICFWNNSLKNSRFNSGKNTSCIKSTNYPISTPPLTSMRLIKKSSIPLQPQLSKQMINIINNERAITIKKKAIKGKFNHLLNHSLVFNHKMYKDNDGLFHHGPETKRRIQKIQKRMDSKKHNRPNIMNRCCSVQILHFKNSPDLFSKERTYFRYEDYYQSPESFLKKNFSTEELTMMITHPLYFKLKSPPFIGSNVNIFENLKQLLNQEEKGKVIDFDDKNSDQMLFKDNRDKDKAIKHKKNIVANKTQKQDMITRDTRNKYCNLMERIKNSLSPKQKKKNEEEKYLLTTDYEKLFEMIEQRKIYSLVKKHKIIINKKQKFEEMKNKNMKIKQNNESEMNQTRKLLIEIENNYMKLLK